MVRLVTTLPQPATLRTYGQTVTTAAVNSTATQYAG